MAITRRGRKPNSSLNFDVPEENVLSLRKKVWEIKIDPEKFKAFFKHYHKEFIALAVFLVGGILLSSTIRTQAQVAHFYPSSCLGGWQNPTYAQGEPEVKDSADKNSFTEGNSAVLKDAQADIFCGDFKGDIPADATPDKFTVSLVWAFDDAHVEHPAPTPFDEIPTQVETPSEDTPIQQSETKDEIKTESEPAAFLVKTVHAQEEVVPEPAPVQVEIQEGESDPDKNIPTGTTQEQIEVPVETETTTTEVIPVETTDQIPETSSDTTVQTETKKDGFLEVRYTLDGVTWETLGIVSNTEEKMSTFEIPIKAISSWEDISKLQISIHELPTFDTNPHVYLDAVELGVEYEDLANDPPQTLSPDQIIHIVKGGNKYVFFSDIDDEYGIWYVDNKTLKSIRPSLTKLETADLVPIAPFIIGDTIVWVTGEGETPYAINAYNSKTGYSSQTLEASSTFEEWLPVENTTVTWRNGSFIVHKDEEGDVVQSPIKIDKDALPPELDTVVVEKASTIPEIEVKDVLPAELTPSFDTPVDETVKTENETEIKDEKNNDEKIPETNEAPVEVTEPATI